MRYLLLILLLLFGCRNNDIGRNITFTGDFDCIKIVQSEFTKLYPPNPVPYTLEIRCLKTGEGGYYRRGNDESERRLIVVCGSTKEELIRLVRHEYQHSVDEFRGVETSVQRELNSKKAETHE